MSFCLQTKLNSNSILPVGPCRSKQTVCFCVYRVTNHFGKHSSIFHNITMKLLTYEHFIQKRSKSEFFKDDFREIIAFRRR